MVTVVYEDRFGKAIRNIKDKGLKERVKKQIRKIVNNPDAVCQERNQGSTCIPLPAILYLPWR